MHLQSGIKPSNHASIHCHAPSGTWPFHLMSTHSSSSGTAWPLHSTLAPLSSGQNLLEGPGYTDLILLKFLKAMDAQNTVKVDSQPVCHTNKYIPDGLSLPLLRVYSKTSTKEHSFFFFFFYRNVAHLLDCAF